MSKRRPPFFPLMASLVILLTGSLFFMQTPIMKVGMEKPGSPNLSTGKLSVLPFLLIGGIHVFRKGVERK
jgi:hypothetical protein